ncbi:MAG TPA: preprotein translocase subunit Sec61beta [Ignisphaera sp.]|uniref:Preprotein translocase subunit Sec61beta n=1 Tax=Ignisphaera aggregans TaxID=334771 RepID=A0A833DUV2_9CREN|nr:preprotein translocase subunit Sec61beta [Ignisphaera sp.]HIP57559.1 preprotein translocase subunit Sec61beta [Ignisphaera aggregans]
MSSRRRRTTPSIASYVGLIRFYEEVEEQIKIHPYLILLLSALTPIVILTIHFLFPYR